MFLPQYQSIIRIMVVALTLSFTITFKAGFSIDIIPELYIFRTSDRSLEIHRPGFTGSAAFDASRHNTFDDNGDFRTLNGLPWAIEVVSGSGFNHPNELVDMVDAFPQFQTWATSLGSQNQTWCDFPAEEKTFSSQ
jgi:LruC domain-containing protein